MRSSHPTQKSIAMQIKELNLTPEEKPLFEEFINPITKDKQYLLNEFYKTVEKLQEMRIKQRHKPTYSGPVHSALLYSGSFFTKTEEGAVESSEQIDSLSPSIPGTPR